jgi:hypothetical protein
MLGYLTGFQLDTPRIFKKCFDFSAIIPDNIEIENWEKNIFWVYCFLKTRHFSRRDAARSTEHATRTLFWVDNERAFHNSFVAWKTIQHIQYLVDTYPWRIALEMRWHYLRRFVWGLSFSLSKQYFKCMYHRDSYAHKMCAFIHFWV